MAKDDSATVEVEDDAVVKLDVEGAENEVVEKPAKGKAAADKDAEGEGDDVVVTGGKSPAIQDTGTTAADQAAAALQETLKSETARRTAAERTAETERNARLDAERRANDAGKEVTQTREQLQARELALLDNGIEAATSSLATHKEAYKVAMAAGEFDKVADAQEAMSKAAAALDRLENAKIEFEANAKKPAPATEGRVTYQPPAAELDRYLSTMALPAQNWLRAHTDCLIPELGGNATKNAKMMSGHYDALAKGFTANSEDYFRVIEEHVGIRTPAAAKDADDEVGTPEPKAKRAAVAPAAPVTRDPPNAAGRKQTREVRLNKDQQEAAKISFPQMTPADAFKEYAKNLVALEAEGKMGRLTH